jgi:hypothetical protein
VSQNQRNGFERTSSHGSTEEFGFVLHTFVEDINVDDIEFRENPNTVFVAAFYEYDLSHSPARAL